MSQMEKIVVFGVGRFFLSRQEELYKRCNHIEIVAYLDNNIELWGTNINGIEVISPKEIKKISFDRILIMSTKTREIKEQLLHLGVQREKISDWFYYTAYCNRGMVRYFCEDFVLPDYSKKEILFIAAPLSYDGSSMAAVHAVRCLQNKGYHVLLAAQYGNKTLIEELADSGLNIALCSSLPYVFPEDLLWIRSFDVVIVNTAVMMVSAYAISKVKPVFWWIHEVSEKFGVFSSSEERLSYYSNEKDFSKINIVAVSPIARDNFNYYYPNSIRKVLPYGLLDEGITEEKKAGDTDKIIFAVIGVFCERKAQKVFLDAILSLDSKNWDCIEFWLIGRHAEEGYALEVLKQAQSMERVKICGELTRREMRNAYAQIDVVVCPSLEETMSIVITEGMMYRKVCITTDTTGIAGYITDGENGFICKAGSAESLCNKMEYVLTHREEWFLIQKRARQTYERYFTLESFGDRFEKMILQTVEQEF